MTLPSGKAVRGVPSQAVSTSSKGSTLRSIIHSFARLFAFASLVSIPSVAFADDLPPTAATPDPKPEGEAKPATDAPKTEGAKDDEKTSKTREDHPRFRGGISAGGGLMFFTAASSFGNASATFGIGGLDGRLGVQINDLIGVYVQPQVGVYGASAGVGGLAGGAALIDFTFIDRLFVGVGGGGVILNSPGAGEVILRVGGYPAMGFGADKVRRKGLMLGIDMRIFIAPSGGATLVAPSPTFNIGYEAF